MRAALLTLVLAASTVLGAAGSPPVGTRMRHLVLHMGYGVALEIDDLRGRLESRAAGPPVFDDVNSYQVAVDYARVGMSPESLTHLMNRYVFASEQAPIKNLSMTIEGQELVQSGTLKKGVSIPFTMRASVSVAPDGRLRIHPTKMKAAGFVSKRVLDFFGVELEDLVKTKDAKGVAVDGDDLLLDPEQILPPPRVRGTVSKAWIEGGRMMLQFGTANAKSIEPPARATNYMYYRGGILRFGKLTMTDTDLLLMDDDPKDPFDFSPGEYNVQLVAGYSKNTPSGGLIVHMPDAADLKARRRTRS
jgi:hypothetical protein